MSRTSGSSSVEHKLEHELFEVSSDDDFKSAPKKIRRQQGFVEKKGKAKKARDFQIIKNPVDCMNVWEKVFEAQQKNRARPFNYDNPNTYEQAPEALGIPSYSEYDDFQSLCRESVRKFKLNLYTFIRITTSETSMCVCFFFIFIVIQ